MNEQSLFLRALEQPPGEPRRLWLEQECADTGQRSRIAALLERHDQAGSFLEKPPSELSEHNEANSSVLAKPISKAKFVDRLIRSKLMTAEEVADCDSNIESLQAAPDGLAYAHAMVKSNKLTGFQAKAIYDGRIKGLKFGEYIILDSLGKGGMGIVYKAKHRRMDRLVAIKVLPRSAMATKGLENRFYREVQTAAKLMHPNIVAALDASEDDGLHYLVMEYVDGQDLGQVLRQSGPLQPDHAVNCIIQAARGLQYAHQQGVIHRDIKPANLLIDGNGTVKVLDMGLARVTGAASEDLDENTAQNLKESSSANIAATDSVKSSGDLPAIHLLGQDTATVSDQTRLTKAGEVMGTLPYMPPEQFTDSRTVDHRGDIYSLGCTLYHLLTGAKPFAADTVGAIFKLHRSNPIPTLRSVRPEIPEHLDLVFQRMLAKEPEQRQNSMHEVIEQLEESLSLIRSQPMVPAVQLQKISNTGAPYTRNSAVASLAIPDASPQIILTYDKPSRRRKRIRLGWIPAGVAVCSLLLIGLLLFVQELGQSDSSLAYSDSKKSLIDANSKLNDNQTLANQQPGRNAKSKVPAFDADKSDNGSNSQQDIEVDEARASANNHESGKPKIDNQAQKPNGDNANDASTGMAPTASKKESTQRSNQTRQSYQNDVDNHSGNSMDWFGGSIWTDGFGFQGKTTFGPSVNRHVQFTDNGKNVSISESSTGITVTVDGQTVEAAHLVELREKDPKAFQLYEKAFSVNDMQQVPINPAWELQRMQLEQLREAQPANPQLKSLLEKMLPNNKKK